MQDQLSQVVHDEALIWDYETASRKLGGLSIRHVQRLAKQGAITRVRIGSRTFFVAQSVRDYLGRLTADTET
ncbi:hypothetical protein A9W94_28530 [Mycobacterium asiaticum]|nr:hypothetical protein A9W94_28530 [Mycobacterium asiaticum]